MATIFMAVLGAGVGLGLLLIVQGIRGRRILPTSDRFFPSGTSAAAATAWLVGALMAGLIVLAITRWIGAGIGVVMVGLTLPWFFGGARLTKGEIDRTQAVATWAEMVRDNMAGAAGLEQALMAAADIAPPAIANEVRVFANELEARPIAEALALLGERLESPAADLVVVSLANAARMEGRDLGPLLTRLAESIRGDVRMRMRVQVGRTRIQTSSKIVLGVIGFTIGLVYATSRDLLQVYDTAEGQIWLIGVFAMFIASLGLMKYFAQIQMPERFTARRTGSRVDLGRLR